MTTTGRTITDPALCDEPESGREVVRLVTDAATKERAVYIPKGGPAPELGTLIHWTTGHVGWTGTGGQEVAVRKIGYSFDPDAALS